MVSVRLPKELEEKINQASAAKNQTRSDVIKEAFNHVKEEAIPFTVGEELFSRSGSNESDRSATYKTRLKANLDKKNPR